jgi:hypothetical protein
MPRRVALVRIASIIRMERISDLGRLAVTSNSSTLRKNTNYMERISELLDLQIYTHNKWYVILRHHSKIASVV